MDSSKQADIMIVVAYGMILPKAVLEISALPLMYGSLLPKWRGAAPINASLWGDKETVSRLSNGCWLRLICVKPR